MLVFPIPADLAKDGPKEMEDRCNRWVVEGEGGAADSGGHLGLRLDGRVCSLMWGRGERERRPTKM